MEVMADMVDMADTGVDTADMEVDTGATVVTVATVDTDTITIMDMVNELIQPTRFTFCMQ